MAAASNSSGSLKLSTGSYQTALCIIPPTELCVEIDRLRALYDKSYGKWPPHINLIYPFVNPENLPQAIAQIRSKLKTLKSSDDESPIKLRVDQTSYFSHRHTNTIFAAPNEEGVNAITALHNALLEDFRHDQGEYNPHLTVGQSQAKDASMRDHLRQKASLCLPIQWDVHNLVVLIREKSRDVNQMHEWGSISLNDKLDTSIDNMSISQGPFEAIKPTGDKLNQSSMEVNTLPMLLESTFQFDGRTSTWEAAGKDLRPEAPFDHTALTISSYNVLLDNAKSVTRERSDILVRSILSDNALADVLVLQEVSDDFLSHLLSQEAIRSHYTFSTHGPPNQNGVGPLPNLRNIVVLSKFKFKWQLLPFKHRYKSAVIVNFETVGVTKGSEFYPLILAGIHLTAGLNDVAVIAKKLQIHTLFNHLSTVYPTHPWIIAGDFNITTSTLTIENAAKEDLISRQSIETLSDLESILSEDKVSDAWLTTRSEQILDHLKTDKVYEGEDGATFNPTLNSLAKVTASTSFNRPQRYDRILLKGDGHWTVETFNMFGYLLDYKDAQQKSEIEDLQRNLAYGSDHWGIRCCVQWDLDTPADMKGDTDLPAPVPLRKAPSGLDNDDALVAFLAEQAMLPTEDEQRERREAFQALNDILRQGPEQTGDEVTALTNSFIMTPVGSYGLGVWSASSDVDCLCIGSISTNTFFTLAWQNLNKAADSRVRILRKVNAKSGTMLELSVHGIKMDLQYCPAAKLVERWSEIPELNHLDPVFDLPIISLTKLKSLRDQDFIRKTTPDFSSFQTAHRTVRLWATQRGIYSAKYGYLGGYHIALLLSRVCKLVARNQEDVTVADIVCTFFNHYATFNLEHDIIFDSSFHGPRPRYRRSARDRMVLLGLHVPTTNVAHTASTPSIRTMKEEFRRADEMISKEFDWPTLLGSGSQFGDSNLPGGVHDFLKSYTSYVKIGVHYWGTSLEKGSMLLGWLESKCVSLLVEIDRRLPNVHARIWPARFTNDATDESEFQGCYLIGLAKADTEERAGDQVDRKITQQKFDAVLERFSTQIRGDGKYFDAETSWIDALHVKQKELGPLQLDTRGWGEYVVSSELDVGDIEQDSDGAVEELSGRPSVKPDTKKPKKSGVAGSAKKLRPAGDVLNRLRWDPNMDSNDYVVGYEDRFVGARETTLDKWKTEQTDDEFIPQHRILYFKQKSTGNLIWERASKTDQLFGSGT